MFIDIANIYVKAGKGGDGAVSFRREKYVPSGGPDGGDGGKGGDVIFKVDDSLRTLVDFRYKRKYKAQAGEDGGGKKCSGKAGSDIYIKVPIGTIIRHLESNKVIADLVHNEQEFVIAKGGRGGKGNQNFATATRQIPNFAKPGEDGDEMNIKLELKLLADVGLIGMPNVGKSTLLSIVSSAKPKIANYHFTTLAPNLGVVKVAEGNSFVMADIPGLIEGAHEGVGLGHEFLKHIERTKLLVHIVDVSGSEGRDPIEDFDKINLELKKYSEKLSKKQQIAVGNKIDIVNDDSSIENFINAIKDRNIKVFKISAGTKKGIDELLFKISDMLSEIEDDFEVEVESAEFEYKIEEKSTYNCRRENEYFIIEGKWIDRIMKTVNIESYDSLRYFQRVLKEKGIIKELERLGIKKNDVVKINDFEFDYIP